MANIILIHGLRGEHHGFEKLSQALRALGHTVFTPDLPGSGGVPELDQKGLDSYSAWLHRYIKSLHLATPPVMLGHSMGSIIVAHFAVCFPDDTDRKIVLLSPLFRTAPERFFNQLGCGAIMAFKSLLTPKAQRKLLGSKFVSLCIAGLLSVDREQKAYVKKMQLAYGDRFTSAPALLADIKIAMCRQTVLPRQKNILVCLGERDFFTPPYRAKKRLLASDVEFTLKIVPGTGHLINFERPESVARIMHRFIES